MTATRRKQAGETASSPKTTTAKQSAPAAAIAPVEPLSELLDAVVELLDKHLTLPNGAADVTALWVAHTHALDAAHISPRLFITSPEKQSGKSSLLILLEHLVYNARRLSSISGAGIFRTIEAIHPTLLLDEADNRVAKSDDITSVLNDGWSRGGKTLRLVGPNYTPREFSTWAAVAIAGIGRLRDTLEDRSIIIEMHRAPRHERQQRVRSDRMQEASGIAGKLGTWAASAVPTLKVMDDPSVPDQLSDRAADNWRPLFSIADLADGGWPERARRAAILLSVAAQSDDGSITIQLLASVRRVFVVLNVNRIHSERLCRQLAEMEDQPWGEWRGGLPMTPHQLARLLKRHKIRPRGMRIGDLNKNGYELEQFRDAFAAYLPRQTSTSQQVNKINALKDAQTPTQSPTDADESSTGKSIRVEEHQANVEDHVEVVIVQNSNNFNDLGDVADRYSGVPGKRFDEQAFLNTETPVDQICWDWRPRKRRGRKRGDERRGPD
jgi:hypothetical protein